MRSNCRESFRLRSTNSVCNCRSPVTCHVMYAEYASTTASVINKASNRPNVGERSCCDGRDTPRAYNAGARNVTTCAGRENGTSATFASTSGSRSSDQGVNSPIDFGGGTCHTFVSATASKKLAPMHKFTRRKMLKLGSAAAMAELAGLGLQGCSLSKIIPAIPSGCAKITDIEHVVILTQENRSFDHYFGSYRGVRGFSDNSPAFQQPDSSNTTIAPVGTLLPFHLDTSQVNAACTHDISHDWLPQHQSWDNGNMDGFVNSRLAIDANDAVL